MIYEVPNIPDPSVPEGESDKDNQEIRKWGEPTTFDFEAKDHISLMKELDLADFERGAKVAGFRGYFLKNDAALLSMALWQFVYDNFSQAGYQPVLAPSLVRMENFIGTGWLPQGREEIYKTQAKRSRQLRQRHQRRFPVARIF
ncbi:MAG: Serine-tRNA ligase [Parcubacteria group bacterium GW2011_GWA2_42_35]|nr:MAG: Serine-tRNA ligase [Parcubacteria group bacterium GW2011_GWA2_42_35]